MDDMTTTAVTAQEHAERTGEIAISPRNHGAVKLHLLRFPDEQSPTVCGRYTFARHTGKERIGPDTKRCQVCLAVADGTWADKSGWQARRHG